jgi:phosphoglycerate dehydrogenase-like enzyme
MRTIVSVSFLLSISCLGLLGQARKIVVTGLPPASIEELRRAAAAGTQVVAATGDQLSGAVKDADALLGTAAPEIVRQGKKLKWVQVYSAGVERYVSPELANRSREEWPRERPSLFELQGKTAVVIGVGGIGMQIAQRASGFGMKVIGVDPKDISYTPLVSRVVPPDRLDSVLPEADVVFVSAPHTKESEGMMGPRQFELMKQGAYFIAVSRGKLYNSEALVKALDSKRLAGAGLDVTNPEPLPKGHPLWKFENVVITPHIAGGSDRVQERRVNLIKENVRRFTHGERLLNVVDISKGY